ncbi:MAG: hypothetical protein KC425_21790, partial [Anaerolineales bacterium]|nr:hypothetical protein [Anaerolineales bacterium]
EAAVLPAQTAVSTLETAVSLPPATPPLLRCVVYVSVPLWPDASLTAGCSQFAQVALPVGTQLQLLDPAPRLVNGPDAACQPNSFLHVQVVATPELAGWVLADALAEAPPGGCQP